MCVWTECHFFLALSFPRYDLPVHFSVLQEWVRSDAGEEFVSDLATQLEGIDRTPGREAVHSRGSTQ